MKLEYHVKEASKKDDRDEEMPPVEDLGVGHDETQDPSTILHT
jgi:hypothetical protein